jgi:hypothetical protein
MLMTYIFEKKYSSSVGLRRFCKRNFQKCPKVATHGDPFDMNATLAGVVLAWMMLKRPKLRSL